MNTSLKITLLSCAVLGFRHGFDYDHIAAITDIASVQKRAATAMRLGLAYALGHAAMVAWLGAMVVLLQLSLPRGMDAWAEKLVGLTLIVLAIYVLGNLVWGDKGALPRSRAALIVQGYRSVRHRWFPRASDQRSVPSGAVNSTGPVAFGIGVIHGLGAETPSQLALFLLAANLGGISRGMAGMGMFMVGLLVMNTLMTASAAGLFQRMQPHPGALRAVAGLTAAYSFCVGWVFLLGGSRWLPALG